ncbi:MAG: TSUP family transporter [Alphaproteobacteria bacterium]|nr:TSUP family transporter [Alphaproteobacteria bacterium]
MTWLADLLAVLSGGIVGFSLGLLGGGGSILAVPLLIYAVGSSLFSVGTFGLTTAASYALSGLVAWTVAFELVAGGVIGGFAGIKAATLLAGCKRALTTVFAGVIFAVAAYMIVRTLAEL